MSDLDVPLGAAAQTAGEAGDDVSLLLVRVPAAGGQ